MIAKAQFILVACIFLLLISTPLVHGSYKIRSTCVCVNCQERIVIKNEQDAAKLGHALISIMFGQDVVKRVGEIYAVRELRPSGNYWVALGSNPPNGTLNAVVYIDEASGCLLAGRLE